MQNTDVSLAPIPEQAPKETVSEPQRHVTDKNRVDPIARSSEPGRKGEESVYIPPSHLHPERSTAQTAFDNPLTASAGGEYGLDHFLDKGAVAESAADQPMEKRSDMNQDRKESAKALGEKVKKQVSQTKDQVSQRMRGGADRLDHAIHRQPFIYALGALAAGLLVGRFLRFSAR
jgi:ElaB/YqjD/DUF883 family membrane-anchored ribosome-binding protein